MSVRYLVLVADPVLLDRDYWQPVHGFRLIAGQGPHRGDPHLHVCLFEDDNAPPELEGKLVDPVLTSHDDGTVTITERRPA
jgi:hypothetical protein